MSCGCGCKGKPGGCGDKAARKAAVPLAAQFAGADAGRALAPAGALRPVPSGAIGNPNDYVDARGGLWRWAATGWQALTVQPPPSGWSVGRAARRAPRGAVAGARAARARVGEKYPGVEIQDFDAAVTQLDNDIDAYDPAKLNPLDVNNWTALKLQYSGFLLRWGQWKTAQASDWWWGDDDRLALTGFKNEYNTFRTDFVKYTVNGSTTAPPVDVTPPSYEDDQEEPGVGQQIGDTLKTVVYIAAAGALVYFVGPPIIDATVRALTKSSAPKD